MKAKVIYFNWRKADALDTRHPQWTGEILADKPELYDYVGDVDYSESSNHTNTCDWAFRMFNRVELGDMNGMSIRSMSVGDIVLFPDGKLFSCQGMGWKEHKCPDWFEHDGNQPGARHEACTDSFHKFQKLPKVSSQS